ncbi:MAG: M13 family metallopeptidase [Bacteroidetes bacterium]|nr:M13 family metallopeptidase [Bacteroidota bacterium]MBK9047422.1 M13 family metallopeptidase [Bacteroidota bacterium]
MKKLLWSVMLIPFVISSCGTKNDAGNDTAGPDFLAANIDSTVKPGDDFFLFANNGWFKKNPIPASEQSNGLWQLIRDTINAQVRQICESSAALKDAPKGSAKQKVGDMFFSGMDSINNNKLGLAALQPELDQIAAINDKATLAKAVAKIHMVSGAPLFNFYVGQDDKQSDKYAIFISQGGLSLPDRTYYVDSDERALKIREKFPVHLKNMFQLMGNDEKKATGSASSFMTLETSLAKASRKREDTRDPLQNYHKMTVAELQQMTPAFDWNTFFTECGLQDVDTVIVGQPEVLKALNTMLEKNSMDMWKDYLRYHLVRGLASYLDDNTYKETFSFFSTTLRGVTEPKPRWKRVTDQTNSALGELIGQVYVDEFLPKGTKEKLTEIGNAIKDVYADRIKNLDWMSDVTKEKALVKLSTIVMKVGYPDKWKDMSSLTVDRSSYARNVMNANEWAMRYMVNKFGNPVRRDEWEMYPQTYNAYYNPSNNEIVVPGCNIIVPGYERVLADDAILYSIIGGSTFGHEITHGFDDQGSKYDEKGNLNNWWTSEDSARFYAKTAMIVQQYGEYNPVDSLRINGELTQGENIADLGGIIMGYEAFKKTKQYIDKQVIAGLTPDQRFFLGYALAWMINERPESLAAQVKSDEHSPAKYRVIGPLSNMPEFHETFSIKEGDFMRRSDSLRVKIW